VSQAAKPASSSAPAPAAAEPLPAIRVILCDAQAIYRVGIRKIFALEDDIRVVAQAETLGQALTAAARFPADVVLLEASLAPSPADAVSEILKRLPTVSVVVLVSKLGEGDTLEYMRRGARGVVTRSISPDLLVKCVRRVAQGETWLDNRGINWVIDAYRSQARQLVSPQPKARLSEKELLIIAGVTQGMRNKEIATEIGTTEQVVKNYLRKVYDKLGVSDRLELALYCVHHQLLNGVQLGRNREDSAASAPKAAPGEPKTAPGYSAAPTREA
jgi:DNA-binding NarL/FixJ family response regulator